MPPRKRRPAARPAPAPDTRVEVGVSRGDVYLKAEVRAVEAEAVAAWMVDALRRIAAARPDVLPSVDHVPGASQFDPWDGDVTERRGRLGF